MNPIANFIYNAAAFLIAAAVILSGAVLLVSSFFAALSIGGPQ